MVIKTFRRTIIEVNDIHEISNEVAKKIKMSQEAELNMERCAEFMARMIQKYGGAY